MDGSPRGMQIIASASRWKMKLFLQQLGKSKEAEGVDKSPPEAQSNETVRKTKKKVNCPTAGGLMIGAGRKPRRLYVCGSEDASSSACLE